MQNDDIFSELYPMQGNDTMFPAELSLGIAYVPYQKLTTLYEPDKAYSAGTLYPDLDKPFLGGRSMAK